MAAWSGGRQQATDGKVNCRSFPADKLNLLDVQGSAGYHAIPVPSFIAHGTPNDFKHLRRNSRPNCGAAARFTKNPAKQAVSGRLRMGTAGCRSALLGKRRAQRRLTRRDAAWLPCIRPKLRRVIQDHLRLAAIHLNSASGTDPLVREGDFRLAEFRPLIAEDRHGERLMLVWLAEVEEGGLGARPQRIPGGGHHTAHRSRLAGITRGVLGCGRLGTADSGQQQGGHAGEDVLSIWCQPPPCQGAPLFLVFGWFG